MPKRMERKVSTTLRLHSKAELNPQDNQESPYILRVSVLSKQKSDNAHFVPKGSQCTLDTNHQQGNIVSKDFLFNILGYKETDFVELTEQEKHGGTSASGHRVTPEGAILLTWYWYYGTSPRSFNDMRFLVTSNPDCELVIGIRSIIKHNLLSSPKLALEGWRILEIFGQTSVLDENYTNLKVVRSDLSDKLGTLRRDLKKARKDGYQWKITSCEDNISFLEKRLKVADIELEVHCARKKLGADPISSYEPINGHMVIRLMIREREGFTAILAKKRLPKKP